jgi:hypothetical protein
MPGRSILEAGHGRNFLDVKLKNQLSVCRIQIYVICLFPLKIVSGAGRLHLNFWDVNIAE